MTGSITAEILAAGPDIAFVIEEAGQDVQVIRPGESPVPVRALLMQQDVKARDRVSDVQYRVSAWQGIFKPDAPVREPGFLVLDDQGRTFWPDAPTQDPGEQGVALIAPMLQLPERIRIDTLTFVTPGDLERDSRTGNMVPGASVSVTASARLTPASDPKVRDMVGADVAEVALIGRWGTLLDPKQRPPGVAWGSTSPLILDGQPGTLTIKLAYPDPDVLQERVLGQRFIASWRSI